MKWFIIDLSAPILPQLYALSGPIATPLVSAITIGHYMYLQFGEPQWLAVLVGVGAFIGFEAAGGACVASAIKLHRRKQHDTDFWICMIGIIVYMASPSLIIKFGYGPLIFAILAAFAVFAGNTFFTIEKEDDLHLKVTKAETNKINAETRMIKAGKTGQVSTVQMDTVQCRSDVQALLDIDKNMSAREIGRKLNISPTTASKHKELWKKQNNIGS